MSRIVRNAFIDLRYGQLLGGVYITDRFSSNSDYMALSYIFKDRIKPGDILVDVGCGRGRVINWWLKHAPNHRIIGIEQNEKIAIQTRRRLRCYENVTIISGDASQNIPADGTLFYLYNPFEAETLIAFKDRLQSLLNQGRELTVLYYHCKYLHVFQEDPAWAFEVTDVGGSSALPFDKLAVIKSKSYSYHNPNFLRNEETTIEHNQSSPSRTLE